VPCHTFPTLNSGKVREWIRLVSERGEVFSPIFVRHHWIAGVLKRHPNGWIRLKIYDSAPSPTVHKDVRKVTRDLSPEVWAKKLHSRGC